MLEEIGIEHQLQLARFRWLIGAALGFEKVTVDHHKLVLSIVFS